MLPTLKKTIASLALFLPFLLSAQQFDIQNIYVDKGKVYVNFKVNEKLEHERYRIKLYSSHDGYSTSLQNVSGPIAQGEVNATEQQMQVVWDAQRELKEFEGNIQLELRGEVSYIPVHTESADVKAKQKKTTTISWEGGNPQDQIRVDLVKLGDVIENLGQVSNVDGEYTWQVTKDIPKGDNYAIRLVNLNNPGEEYETNTFKIKSGVGLAVKLAPVGALLIGGGIYAVSSGLIGDGGDGEGEGAIVDPKDPPN